MMERDRCLEVLARHVTDEIVVATYQAAFEWRAIKPRPLNYVSIGAMGVASSHALGLALGRPDKRVIVLDGDGSLLMNLGSLVTIAEARPRNLVHCVCHNGTYEANGSQPLPAASRLDFPGFARAAGIDKAFTLATLDDVERAMPELLRGDGPIFACLEVEQGPRRYEQDYPYIHSAEARRSFKAALDADRPKTR
jgi:phosphonopyruvate decarboxylase